MATISNCWVRIHFGPARHLEKSILLYILAMISLSGNQIPGPSHLIYALTATPVTQFPSQLWYRVVHPRRRPTRSILICSWPPNQLVSKWVARRKTSDTGTNNVTFAAHLPLQDHAVASRERLLPLPFNFTFSGPSTKENLPGRSNITRNATIIQREPIKRHWFQINRILPMRGGQKPRVGVQTDHSYTIRCGSYPRSCRCSFPGILDKEIRADGGGVVIMKS